MTTNLTDLEKPPTPVEMSNLIWALDGSIEQMVVRRMAFYIGRLEADLNRYKAKPNYDELCVHCGMYSEIGPISQKDSQRQVDL